MRSGSNYSAGTITVVLCCLRYLAEKTSVREDGQGRRIADIPGGVSLSRRVANMSHLGL
jgi:hypothetical protein